MNQLQGHNNNNNNKKKKNKRNWFDLQRLASCYVFSFIRNQYIDQEDHCAPIRVGSFQAHKITSAHNVQKTILSSLKLICFQQRFQDQFVLILSTSTQKGFIFRVHYSLKAWKSWFLIKCSM